MTPEAASSMLALGETRVPSKRSSPAPRGRPMHLLPVQSPEGRPTPKRALGYARVSSLGQTQGSSLADQEAAIRAYAASIGVRVAHVYVEAESGAYEKIERREQMRTLLDAVQPGDLVICDKLDRWSRDRVFTLQSVRSILQLGATFYAVAERMDPSTHDGHLMLGFLAVLADADRERIKERMIGTRKRLRDRGLYAEGLPPFGYRRSLPKGERGPEKNALRIDEKRAELVRECFRLANAGHSLSGIVEETGLTRDRIRSILRSRVYLGEVLDSQGRWIKGQHAPIIDADTFARAQAGLEARRLGGPRPRGTPAETSGWFLRDVATCALCGARMGAAYAGPHDARRYYYRCTKSCSTKFVRVDTTEREAEPLILERLEELRAELASEPKAPRPTPAADYAERRARLQKKRERFLEAFGDGLMTRDELRAAMSKLDAEGLRLDAAEKAAHRVAPLDDPATRRAALREVSTIRRAWKSATPEERREIVGVLATHARFASGKPVSFTWRPAEDLAERA